MTRLSAKEHRVLDMIARKGEINWSRVHANTVHALERKGLIGWHPGYCGAHRRRVLTTAGNAARADRPNIFDDLFAEKDACL